jgi:hypothetical protein
MRLMRLLLAALLISVSLQAAPLPISAVGNPWQVVARTTTPAFIIVQLSNPDGSPKIDAELPKANADNPSAGVELKGSKWSFDTFQIPKGFQARGIQTVEPATLAKKAVTQAVPLPGQLRVVQIAPAFREGDASDPRAGVYYFTIQPMYGFPGGQKQQLPWVSGHYVFRITYRDGANTGTTLGELVIP